MAIDFPNSPAVNDTLVVGTTTWKYDGTKWNIVDTVSTSTAFSPIGTVVNYMGSNPPTGWILCDGSSKLRSTYPSLFAIVSTTFGQGSSPGTTFALPSFVGTTGIFIIRATDDMSVTTASNLLAVPVGTMQQFLSSTNIPTGWLRADGSAYSRTSYADLFALLCTTYTGATTTSSSTTVSGLTGMSAGTHTGWGIAGSGIPSGAYISSVTNGTTVVISANATSNQSGIASLVIGPYGFTGADNTTTFNFPNIVGSGSGSPLYYIKATLSGDVQPSTIAHASNHIRAGTDVIDGDRVQVDYVPSAYTRNAAATGAGAVTDLTAHLAGIDADKLRVGATAGGDLAGTYPNPTLAATTPGRIVQALQAQSTQITVNTTAWTTIVSQTITTTKANSKLICMFSGDCNANDTGAWKRVGIFIDGTLQYNVLSSTQTAGFQEVVAMSGVFTVATAGSHTVSIQAQQGSGSSTFAEEGGNHKNNLVVMELIV